MIPQEVELARTNLGSQDAETRFLDEEEGEAEWGKLIRSQVLESSLVLGGIKMSLNRKMIFRDCVVVVTCLLLSYQEQIQKISCGLEALISIIGLLLLMVPQQDKAVGPAISSFINLVVIWPIHLLAAIFTINVFSNVLAGYILVFLILDTMMLRYALIHQHLIIPVMVAVIVYAIVLPLLYSVMVLEDSTEQEAFNKSYELLLGSSFVLAVPFTLNLLGALFIFPWSSITSLREKIAHSWYSTYKLMQVQQEIYMQVAKVTLFPVLEDATGEENSDLPEIFPEANTTILRDSVGAVNGANTEAYSLCRHAFMETRWKFDGSGHDIVEVFFLVSKYSRFARCAAQDYVSKIERTRKNVTSFRKHLAHNEPEKESMKKVFEMLYKLNNMLLRGSLLIAQTTFADINNTQVMQEYQMRHDILQRELDEACAILEKNSLVWAKDDLLYSMKGYDNEKRLNEDDPLRMTLLLNYVVLVKKFVSVHRKAWKMLVNRSPSEKRTFIDWKITTSIKHRLHLEKQATAAHEQANEKHSKFSGFLDKLNKLNYETEYIVAVKMTLGTVLMSLPGYFPESYQWYGTVEAIQAIFTFLVIVYKLYVGVILERIVHRLVGIMCAFIYGGLVWTFACALFEVSSKESVYSLILISLQLPLLVLYFWIRENHPHHAYLGFAITRTYASLTIPLVPHETEKGSSAYWILGGWVIAWSTVGAVLGLVVGVLIWPTTGKKALRRELSKFFRDMKLHSEGLLLKSYGKYSSRRIYTKSPAYLVGLYTDIDTIEIDINIRLLKANRLLELCRLENFERMYFDVGMSEYGKAIWHSQGIWSNIWKIHNIGDITTYILQREPGHVHIYPSTAREILAWHRGVTLIYHILSRELENTDRASLPVLRPLVATPFLLKEVLNDFICKCYSDSNLMKDIYSTQDIAFLASFVVFRDMMMTTGENLEGLFDFIESFRRKPAYAEELRNEDMRTFNAYKAV